jgi:hypothetical protein
MDDASGLNQNLNGTFGERWRTARRAYYTQPKIGFALISEVNSVPVTVSSLYTSAAAEIDLSGTSILVRD